MLLDHFLLSLVDGVEWLINQQLVVSCRHLIGGEKIALIDVIFINKFFVLAAEVVSTVVNLCSFTSYRQH